MNAPRNVIIIHTGIPMTGLILQYLLTKKTCADIIKEKVLMSNLEASSTLPSLFYLFIQVSVLFTFSSLFCTE